jgi:hypothetical protein
LRSFSDIVGSGEDLLGLFVQEQMIVAEVRPRHVPVEIFRFHVECEHVGSTILSAPEISRAALGFRSVGVSSGAAREALAFRVGLPHLALPPSVGAEGEPFMAKARR